MPSIKPPTENHNSYININSIRYKFDILKPMLTEVSHILIISETKLDDSFPELQYYIEGFRTPFKLDHNKHGGRGGILLYVRNNINAILLMDHVFPNNIEVSFIEVKVNICKWLVCCLYITLTELMFLLTLNKLENRIYSKK